MAHDPTPPEPGWERGWDGHARAQRERLAHLTLEQKLDWLEEAHRFVLRLHAPSEQGPAKESGDGD